MKGKIINFMLAAALMTSASASFVSCKDTESDDYQQLEYKINNLDSKLADQLKAVDDQIAALQSKLNSIKECDCNESQVRELIAALTTRVGALETASTSQAASISDIQTRLSALEAKSPDESWKQQIINLQSQLDALKNSAATQSDIERLTSLYNQLTEKVNNGATQEQVADILKQIQELQSRTDDTSWKDDIAKINEEIEKLKNNSGSSVTIDELKKIQDRLTALENQTVDESWKDEIARLDKRINDLPTGGVDDTSWKKLIDDINNTTIPNLRAELVRQINAANTAAANAKTLAQTAKDAADDANRAAANAAAAAATADGKASAAQTTADEAKTKAEEAKTAADNAAELARTLTQQAEDRLNNKITDELNNLEQLSVDMVTALITQVIVQSVSSPAVGELAVPLDVQANMLVTYYGESAFDQSYDFPTNVSTYFYDAAEAADIDEADLYHDFTTIESGTLIARDGKSGNAGTLWVTVNPSTVDVSSTKFTLQNSQGTPYDILENATKDNETVLKWGWTRAGGENFYAVPATIDKSNLDTYKISFQGANLRASVKKLVNDRDQTKAALKELAKNVAKALYENMTTDLPRLAVAKEYSATLGTKTSATMKNVSEMNILAGAVKPVGFGSLDNVDAKGVPGLGTVETRINRFINNLKLDNIKFDLGVDKVDKVRNVGNLTRNGEDFFIDVTVTDENGHEASGTVKVNGLIDDMLKIVNDTLTKANNDAVNQFNTAVDAINEVIDEMENGFDVNGALASTKADMTRKVSKYLDRINTSFSYWFNRVAGSALHPVMLFEGTDGAAHRLLSVGTTVHGTSIKLIPTTYTYELLAPAYKKYVTVCGKTMSGENLNKVIEGDEREVTIEGLQSGQSYTILYEAVDYTGKVMARKYVINVE